MGANHTHAKTWDRRLAIVIYNYGIIFDSKFLKLRDKSVITLNPNLGGLFRARLEVGGGVKLQTHH